VELRSGPFRLRRLPNQIFSAAREIEIHFAEQSEGTSREIERVAVLIPGFLLDFVAHL
jgi:hypothetical protein